MRFPDTVSILRAHADEYGNPAASWDNPTVAVTAAFVLHATVLMPTSADIRAGDRIGTDRGVFAVVGEPELLRSPSRAVMWNVSIERVPEA